jgi:formylglycine-generating enzyme required for sulfatase activity
MFRTTAVTAIIVACSSMAGLFAQQNSDKGKTTRKAGEVIENSIGMKLAYIPPGEFIMGSPKSEQQKYKEDVNPLFNGAEQEVQHKVKLSKGFYLGVYTVTQEEYEKVMGKNPSHFCAGGEGKDAVAGLDTQRFPVETVSWKEAKAFCQKLSANEGKTYRLPTEAEWEYACRAGTKTAFHFGDMISTDQANFRGDEASVFTNDKKGEYCKRTMKVGSFPTNAWGLHDMHGNVWQWCEDWFAREYYSNSPETDPLNDKIGFSRVVRGGRWNILARGCRSANRFGHAPEGQHIYLGFRVARSSVE